MKDSTMKKLLFTLVLGGVLIPTSFACTKITNNFESIGVYSARDMGFCMKLDTDLVVFPRGINESGMAPTGNSLTWQTKYGFIATEERNLYHAAADGLNEKGLGFHLLYLGGSELESRNIQKSGISLLMLSHYILGNFTNVNEVINSLSNYQVVNNSLKIQSSNLGLPFHLTVEDSTGDAAVVEFIKGKVKIYHGAQDNVLTNEPNYAEQLKNLAQVKKSKYYTNSLIPGGAEPTNRFVRAKYYSETLPQPDSANEAVSYMFAAIQGTMVPFYRGYGKCDFGSVVHSGIVDDVWPSQYQTVLDHTHLKYYFTNDYNGNRLEINLTELNLNAGAPILSLDADQPDLSGDVSSLFKPR